MALMPMFLGRSAMVARGSLDRWGDFNWVRKSGRLGWTEQSSAAGVSWNPTKRVWQGNAREQMNDEGRGCSWAEWTLSSASRSEMRGKTESRNRVPARATFQGSWGSPRAADDGVFNMYVGDGQQRVWGTGGDFHVRFVGKQGYVWKRDSCAWIEQY